VQEGKRRDASERARRERVLKLMKVRLAEIRV